MKHCPLPLIAFSIVEKTLADILLTPETSEWAYIVEINLTIFEELRYFFADYPLAPSREVVGIGVMSNEQVDMLGKLGITTLPKVPKRLQTLHPKEDYVLHYITLKLYHELGMKITHLGKVLQFRQSHWMATIVDLNTRLRKAAVDKNSRGSISSNERKIFIKNSSEHNEKLSNHWRSFSQNRLFSNKNFVGQTYVSCCDHPWPRQAFHVSFF